MFHIENKWNVSVFAHRFSRKAPAPRKARFFSNVFFLTKQKKSQFGGVDSDVSIMIARCTSAVHMRLCTMFQTRPRQPTPNHNITLPSIKKTQTKFYELSTSL